MENRYLCRAKRIDNGEWTQGDLVHSVYKKGDTCVGQYGNEVGMHTVDPSTICQCTGIKDKNGKLIFENDILEAHLDDKFPDDITRTRVVWEKNGWVTSEPGAVDREYLDDFDTEHFEVVGNAFDGGTNGKNSKKDRIYQ